MAKEDQEQRFRAFVQGENFAQRVQNIHNGYPVLVRLSSGEVMENNMGLFITSGGGNQGSAMAPLRRV